MPFPSLELKWHDYVLDWRDDLHQATPAALVAWTYTTKHYNFTTWKKKTDCRWRPFKLLLDVGTYTSLSVTYPCIVLHRESSKTCDSEVTCKVASRLPEPWTTTLFAAKTMHLIVEYMGTCTRQSYNMHTHSFTSPHHLGGVPALRTWQHSTT